jgi:hypothetical protein
MHPRGEREKIMREVTATEVAEVLEEAVGAKGEDFVYSTPDGRVPCLYLHGDQPGCLVGDVLLRLGADPEGLRETGPVVDLNWTLLGLRLPVSAIEALQGAQEVQDDKKTWGEARDAFYARLETPVAAQDA